MNAIKEIIILLLIIIINIPIIYYVIISFFYKNFSNTKPEQKDEKDKTENSQQKIPITAGTIIKAIIIIAFIIGLFTAEIILIDKIGITYFEYPFIKNLLNLGT